MGWISPAIAEMLSDSFVQLSNFKRLETTGELTIL
jgi:L-asparaginase